MSIGKRIAAMRGYRRMNQDQLGGSVGVSKQTVSNWEHDYRKPDAESIRALCQSLECTSDYLLGLADRPSEHIRWES